MIMKLQEFIDAVYVKFIRSSHLHKCTRDESQGKNPKDESRMLYNALTDIHTFPMTQLF